jgi:hypothetical protein
LKNAEPKNAKSIATRESGEDINGKDLDELALREDEQLNVTICRLDLELQASGYLDEVSRLFVVELAGLFPTAELALQIDRYSKHRASSGRWQTERPMRSRDAPLDAPPSEPPYEQLQNDLPRSSPEA